MFENLVAVLLPVDIVLNLLTICVEHVSKPCWNAVASRYCVEFDNDLC